MKKFSTFDGFFSQKPNLSTIPTSINTKKTYISPDNFKSYTQEPVNSTTTSAFAHPDYYKKAETANKSNLNNDQINKTDLNNTTSAFSNEKENITPSNNSLNQTSFATPNYYGNFVYEPLSIKARKYLKMQHLHEEQIKKITNQD